VHHEIIRRADPELAEQRFTKGGWQKLVTPPSWAAPTRKRFGRRRREQYPERIDRPSEQPAVSRAPKNLSDHRLRQEGSRERVELLHELTSDPNNAAWDLIDREAVERAADRYDELPRSAQVELMGAASAALWLRDGPRG
jgi:hypothetical protein